MPLPNYHSFRLRHPDKFSEIRVIKTLPNGILIYGGKLKDKPSTTKAQSYKFPIDKFNFEASKKWMAEHDLTPIESKPASSSFDSLREAITYTNYPQSASDSAKKAIEWKKKYGDEVKGGTRVGWTRASQLANRKPLSLDTVRRMASFSRHRQNSKVKDEFKSTPWRDNGYVAFLCWGGESGIDWAIKTSEKAKRMNEKESIHIPINYFKESTMAPNGEGGKIWTITIIEGGLSKNGFYYDDEVLKESVSIFEGVKVYAHQYGGTLDHRPTNLSNPDIFISNLVGYIDNVKFIESSGRCRLEGSFHCTSQNVRDLLLNIWNENRSQMPGFSIDVDGEAQQTGTMKKVNKIIKANSVDIVTNPSAGGAFERMIASVQNQKINNSEGEKKMEELIAKLLPLVKSGVITLEGIEGKTDDEIIAMLTETLSLTEAKATGTAPKKEITKEQAETMLEADSLAEIKEMLAKVIGKKEGEEEIMESKNKEVEAVKESITSVKKEFEILRTEKDVEAVLIKESMLDDAVKTRIRKQFAGKIANVESIKEAVKDEKLFIESILESSKPKSEYIQFGDAPIDQMSKALDLLVDPSLSSEKEYKGVSEFTGIREAVQRICQIDINAAFRNPKSIKESTTSDFPVMLGDSMNKRIVKEYNAMKAREVWTKFTNEESFNNLNVQTLSRLGGFGELSTVAEDGTYPNLTTPSEDNPTYSPVKKGGLFSLTEEMLINDNLRGIRQFPKEMARAAIYSLNKFVFDLITGNDGSDTLNTKLIYDGGVLYSTSGSHGNLGVSALSASSFQTGVSAMANQTQADSGNPIGINAKYLLTAMELRDTAWNITKNELTQANANGGSIQNPLSRYAVEPVQIPKAYTANNSNYWILIADPMDIEGITIGYLNGKKEPEILLQDQPTISNVFTNDQIRYRVKFRFGGAIVDYRAFYGYMG